MYKASAKFVSRLAQSERASSWLLSFANVRIDERTAAATDDDARVHIVVGKMMRLFDSQAPTPADWLSRGNSYAATAHKYLHAWFHRLRRRWRQIGAGTMHAQQHDYTVGYDCVECMDTERLFAQRKHTD
jgi:hypothetical protein